MTPASSPEAQLKDGPLKSQIEKDFGGVEGGWGMHIGS